MSEHCMIIIQQIMEENEMNEVRWIGSFQDANNNQLSQLVFLDDDMPANVRVTNPEVYEDSDLVYGSNHHSTVCSSCNF